MVVEWLDHHCGDDLVSLDDATASTTMVLCSCASLACERRQKRFVANDSKVILTPVVFGSVAQHLALPHPQIGGLFCFFFIYLYC